MRRPSPWHLSALDAIYGTVGGISLAVFAGGVKRAVSRASSIYRAEGFCRMVSPELSLGTLVNGNNQPVRWLVSAYCANRSFDYNTGEKVGAGWLHLARLDSSSPTPEWMERTQEMDRLTKLYVEITAACNLACQMCVRRAWDEQADHMSDSTFGKLLAQLRQFPAPPTLHLGGYGEPMSHPSFLELVEQAKAIGARVEITTNGTLLDADTATALIELDLDRLVVSIDGLTQESYGGLRTNGTLSQVIENFRHLYRLKLRGRGRHSNPQVGIAFVAMKRSVAELAKLPRLATRIGAWDVQVSNLVPHTPEMMDEILYEQSLTACAFRASRWVASLSLPKFDLDASTLAPLGQVFSSTASLSLLDTSLSTRNDYCRFAWEGYAAVRWDGQISPCLPLMHDHPMYLRGRRKDVTHYGVGNINEQPIRDVWESDEFVSFRESLREFSFSPCTTCGGCERFAENLIDCSDRAFPVCGGCLWAQGFVQCP